MTVAPIHPNSEVAELGPPSGLAPAVASLVEWAESARAANQIARSLVETSFVPEAFRGKPAEATAAILSGAEVGLSPMAALRSFDIIAGTAAPRALTLRAVVQSHGHEVWVEKESTTEAKVCGRRRGTDVVQTSTWTIERAQKLGLTKKNNWTTQPQAMLVARATAEVCRRVAADAILGLPYAVEELEDADETPAPKKRTAKRAALVPVPEPSTDDPQFASPEEAAAEAATDQGDDTAEACQVCGGTDDHDLDMHAELGIDVE